MTTKARAECKARWTRGPIVATLPFMSEDDPKPEPKPELEAPPAKLDEPVPAINAAAEAGGIATKADLANPLDASTEAPSLAAEPTEAPSLAAEPAEAPSLAAEPAEAPSLAAEPAEAPEAPALPPPPPGPVNKLHEWGAALVIMAILTFILFGFLFFLRGASI